MSNPDSGPTVTFGPSAARTVVHKFGWVFEDGTLVDKASGEPVESFGGQQLHLGNFAGILKNEDGRPVPIADDFSEICDYMKQQVNA